MLNPWSVTSGHEDLFLERYERLLGWALQLAGGDRQLAEDLLHDAYVQFTLLRPALDSIHNLDGYLNAMLRNLRLSQARAAARGLPGGRSLVSFDSAETGLSALDRWAVDGRARLQARDELRSICHYACVRKETSKSGSVLLLRFFHGYYPSETARVLRASRAVVDNWLRLARREARLYLDRPDTLAFMTRASAAPLAAARPAETTADIFDELRNQIWQSRERDCLSREQLQQLYRAAEPETAEAIDCATLGHLVSCPRCLDEVNRLLGLPTLAERHPADTLGPDRGSGGGPSASGTSGGRSGGGRFNVMSIIKSGNSARSGGSGSAGKPGRTLQRRARETFEHRPEELHFSVNGFVLSSLPVGYERSEQTLNLNLDEKLSFVEVFSEQGIRLLLLNLEPPPEGLAAQTAEVELSDGRSLKLTVSFETPWPTLHTVYHDPLLSTVEERRGDEETEGQRDGEIIAPALRLSVPPSLRLLLAGWRPVAVVVLVSLLVVAALLLDRRRTPAVSAAELLLRAEAAEEAAGARANLVLHRSFDLEERRPNGGAVVSRRRIEIWRSAVPVKGRIEARRVYDERNRLIAGEWVMADGSRAVYQRPAAGEAAPSSIRNQELWQSGLSAKAFSRLIGRAENSGVEVTPAAYVIAYRSGGDQDELLRATLTLNKADLRAIAQTMLVRRGNSTLDFRFVESGFERRAASAVAPEVFEPDPELILSSDRAPEEAGQVFKLKPEVRVAPPSAPSPFPSVVATTSLEIEVLQQLHQARADLGEQVSVTRTADGKLRVEAILDTDERKAEILRALGPVSNHPLVRLEIRTVAEVIRQQPPSPPSSTSGAVPVEETAAASAAIPVHLELRRYFAGKLAHDPRAAKADEEVRQFATRMLARSNRMLSHAWAMRRLIERFSPETLRGLDAETRTRRLAMIGEHARSLEQETAGLRRELEPIFFPTAPPDESEERAEGEITDEAALARAVTRLFELVSAHDRAIRSAFAISSAESAAPVVKTPRFRRSLRGAERLAARIAASK